MIKLHLLKKKSCNFGKIQKYPAHGNKLLHFIFLHAAVALFFKILLISAPSIVSRIICWGYSYLCRFTKNLDFTHTN